MQIWPGIAMVLPPNWELLFGWLSTLYGFLGDAVPAAVLTDAGTCSLPQRLLAVPDPQFIGLVKMQPSA